MKTTLSKQKAISLIDKLATIQKARILCEACFVTGIIIGMSFGLKATKPKE